MTSFYLNHLFKGPTSKYSHILRCWGLGLQYMNLGDTVQPMKVPNFFFGCTSLYAGS